MPEEVVLPFGKENGEPVRFDGMFHPVGSNLTMAKAKRSRIDAFGISYEGNGRVDLRVRLGGLSRLPEA